MTLENLMEEKQLDFSRPFLSVRRVPSQSPAAAAKEPERRNNRRKPPTTASTKLPPFPRYKPELQSGPIALPGTVPFLWERSPGRPLNESSPDSNPPPAVPRPPPGRRRQLNAKQNSNNGSSDAGSEEGSAASSSSFRNSHSAEEILREELMEGTRSSGGEDDDDESFVDALETLSRAESSLLNCSVSGISGFDGVDMRPNRTLSGDLQAREFMIGRFLPAAQAMASESPQYSPQYPTKKQPILREQARQVTTINRFEKQPPSPEPAPRGAIVPYLAQCDDNTVEEVEDEDENDDYIEPNTASLGICGLLPRLCLQNSLCRLNPVPGVRKQARMRAASVRTRSVKYNKAAEYGRRVMNESPSSRNCSKQTSSDIRNGSNTNAGWSHNEPSQPDAPKENGFLGVPERIKDAPTIGSVLSVKEAISFAELLAHEGLEWESRKSPSTVAEKTLCIDSAQMVKKPEVVKDEELKLTACNLKKEEEELEKSGSFGSGDLSVPDNVARVDDRRDQDLMPAADEDSKSASTRDSSQGSINEDSTNFTRPKLAGGGRGNNDSQNQHLNHNTRPSQRKPCNVNPLPPPSPKSPSESWLKKALPTVASRTQLSKSPLGLLMYSKEAQDHHTTNLSDPTWESIVKTSGEKNRRFPFSEGQLTSIPEA